VLAAFRAGEPAADVAERDAAGQCIAKGEVRGEFLRGLFLGDYDEKADYRGTGIVGAIISDVLDMEFCETRFPVRFRDCSFAQEVKLQQLSCPELDFGGCALKKGLYAEGAKVAGNVNLKKVNATVQVSLAGADIGGVLVCSGGKFHDGKNDALRAQNIKVAQDVHLDNGFNANGTVRFTGANIGARLWCEGGIFRSGKNGGALVASNIKVAADMVLSRKKKGRNSIFWGAVRFAGADIGGELICSSGHFWNVGKDALTAKSIKVAEGVSLNECFRANGEVNFRNAGIGGNLVLRNGKLTSLNLAGANVSGEFQDDAEVYKDDQGGYALDIDGFRYQQLNAVRKRVKDRLAWVASMSKGDEFRPQPYEQLMQVYRATGYTNEARDVGYALEQKRQEKMKRGWWKGWYEVLRLTIGYGYKPFRFFGWFLGIIFLGGILFSGLLCGVSLEKTFSLWKGVAVEASKNHWNQCEALRMHPTHPVVYLDRGEKTGGAERPENHPQFIPLLYAAETAFPLFPLGQTGNWHPATWWVKFIQWFITLLGTVALAILVLYGAGLLGPRWRDG